MEVSFMKKMLISWIIVASCLFGSLYFIGMRLNKEYKQYRDYEADLEESAMVYLNLTNTKVEKGKTFKIKMDEMLKSGSLSTKNVDDDTCDGYVNVKNTGGEYQYSANIKCGHYTSVDYK